MRARILLLLVLLVLFPAMNILSVTPCTTQATGGCITVNQCDGKNITTCENYYHITNTIGVGFTCNWHTLKGSCTLGNAGCNIPCSLGKGCATGYATSTTACTNFNGVSQTACQKQYQTGVTDKRCFWTGTTCTPQASCIPEFFGIEFGEMEISTGIIAVIGAIVLPMFLFRKKK